MTGTARHIELGRTGEDMACEFLISCGYDILHRNWRSGHLEIDIVAMKNESIVFIEVKTRKQRADHRSLLSEKKQQSMMQAANRYMKMEETQAECRLDLLVIEHLDQDINFEHYIAAL